MIIRKCDFCGAENAEEVNLPQPNGVVASSQGVIVARYRQPGFYYEKFDLCSECQDRLFNFIEQLKRKKNKTGENNEHFLL